MKISQYLEKVCLFAGLEQESVEVIIQEIEDRIEVNLMVPEEDASLFIGSKGETLYALQYLLRLTFKDEFPDTNLVLDINGYRQQKEQKLIEKAMTSAQKVSETGQPVTFRYLNSYERYLIHTAVAEEASLEGITTESEDVELEGVKNERWLTIKVKDEEN